jgi:predicted transcriptional regulator
MKNRSKMEIFGMVLAVANSQGVTKTEIMYRAFLSFTQMKEILTTMTERGLLDFDRTTQTFKTTPKGLKVVQAYTELNELMNGWEKSEETRYAESQIY